MPSCTGLGVLTAVELAPIVVVVPVVVASEDDDAAAPPPIVVEAVDVVGPPENITLVSLVVKATHTYELTVTSQSPDDVADSCGFSATNSASASPLDSAMMVQSSSAPTNQASEHEALRVDAVAAAVEVVE